MWSQCIVRSVEVDYVASFCVDWLANDETATLQTILSIIPATMKALQRDVVVKLQLLVLRVFDDETCWDWALIDKCKCTMLLSVHFGKLKVYHRLE